jgi:hypothetical protein
MHRKHLDEFRSVMVGREECLRELSNWGDRGPNALLGALLSREGACWVLAIKDFEVSEQAWLPDKKRYEEPGQAMKTLGELLDRVELRRQGRDEWPSEEWWGQRNAEVERLLANGNAKDLPKVTSIMEFSGD